MKITIITLTIMLICLLTLTGVAQKQKMTKNGWEYLTVHSYETGFKENTTLNEMGTQGWELVSATNACNSEGSCQTAYYFKRAR